MKHSASSSGLYGVHAQPPPIIFVINEGAHLHSQFNIDGRSRSYMLFHRRENNRSTQKLNKN